jgi:hypothetical protein
MLALVRIRTYVRMYIGGLMVALCHGTIWVHRRTLVFRVMDNLGRRRDQLRNERAPESAELSARPIQEDWCLKYIRISRSALSWRRCYVRLERLLGGHLTVKHTS